MKKIVISLIGMIGCGKTSALKELAKRGYPVIEEGYMSSKIRFDNRLSISKWFWVANWFNVLYDYFDDHPECHLVFTDRSAMEAGLWTPVCYPFKMPLETSFKELELMGYDFVNIYLFCDDETLKSRIALRLNMEPHRKLFNEGDAAFIDELNKSYKSLIDSWSYVIDTSKASPAKVCEMIIDIVDQITEKYDLVMA